MSRIYVVIDKRTFSKRMIRANSRAQALIHVARSAFIASVAKERDMMDADARGIKVDDAGAEPEPASEPAK